MSTEKDLYRQKRQAELEEWKAEIESLKAKAQRAHADAKIEIDQRVRYLERHMEEAEAKLAELGEASDDAWDSIKEGIESAWTSMEKAVDDAASRFKS